MYRYTTDTDAVSDAARSLTSCTRALADVPAVLVAELYAAGEAVGEVTCSATLHELAREWADELAASGEDYDGVGILTEGAAQAYGDTERQVRATMGDPTCR